MYLILAIGNLNILKGEKVEEVSWLLVEVSMTSVCPMFSVLGIVVVVGSIVQLIYVQCVLSQPLLEPRMQIWFLQHYLMSRYPCTYFITSYYLKFQVWSEATVQISLFRCSICWC